MANPEPNLDKNTIIRCYFGTNTIRVATALGFNRKLVKQIETAYSSYSTMYVPLVTGVYGTFWYDGLSGYFFELKEGHSARGIQSMIGMLPKLRAVNKKSLLILQVVIKRAVTSAESLAISNLRTAIKELPNAELW